MGGAISSSKAARSLSRRSLVVLLVVIGVALALLVLDGRGWLDSVKGGGQVVLQPTAQRLTQTRLGVGSWLDGILHFGSLQRRNAALESEIARLQAENARLQSLQSENTALKIELGIRQLYDWETLAAPVVQINADNGRRTMRVARGRLDGIQVGMAVVAKEGGSPAGLIGVVDQVYAQTADVLLITDGGAAISARTTTAAPASGLVIGQWQRGSRIRLEGVDRDAALAVGDFVVTAGLSKALASATPLAQIPAGVPIGSVEQVARNSREQTAELRPFVDPDRVRLAWIVLAEQSK